MARVELTPELAAYLEERIEPDRRLNDLFAGCYH